MTVRNITKVFRLASDEDITSGLSWYREAYGHACRLSPDNPSLGAGVLAALSPMTSWPMNVRRANEVFATGTTKGLPANVAKAIAIRNGAEPLTILSGPKVIPFYQNIMGIWDTKNVTIDRHAIDIAIGKPLSDAERAPYFGKRLNALLISEYVRATEILSKESGLDLTPAQLQAIVWVWWRKNRAAANHG